MIISGLAKYYGSELILKDFSASIGPGDRIGLVGANGIGKTTLLKVLAGLEGHEKGQITIASNYIVKYADQNIGIDNLTLYQYLREAFGPLLEVGRRMKEAEQALSDPQVFGDEEALQRAMNSYARYQQEWEKGGGYDFEVQIKSCAQGLGFSSNDLSKNVNRLSGGQQVRARLARLLLEKPDLLLLDEPTNHLDIDALEWLEAELAKYPKAFLIVSHDRSFLNKTVNKIWEIADGRVYQYRGNYDQFRQQRSLRQKSTREAWEKQQAEIRKIEDFIRKFGAGTRASQAKSREKQLEKMEVVELESADPEFHFSFQPRRQSGRRVLEFSQIHKNYGEQPVLNGAMGEIARGDRIALVGPNGSGKTTLLNVIAGKIDFFGHLKWGVGVDLGYLEQEINVSGKHTVLEELYSFQRSELGQLRSVLARFLFRADDVFKSVQVLSGGEKSRLALAKLFLESPNFLVLDEPTNHLDIYAREALEEALQEFPGTLLFVSHDRYFMDKIATKLWIMEQGRIVEFLGSYEEYRHKIRQEQLDARKSVTSRRSVAQRSSEPSKNRQEELRLAQIEAEIEQLEELKAQLEEKLSDSSLYQDEESSRDIVIRYRDVEDRLDECYRCWDELVEKKG